ncbi:MAG: gamma carbonic anhydrase family protein [Calditrichia bacterium]
MTASKTDLPDHTLTIEPTVAEDSFIARGARVMGDVTLAAGSSVWYNCVLRGDINSIHIGERSNIQDGVVIHNENFLPCVVGNDVTIGHGAILHGCHIEDGCLVGMGATILSGAVIKRGSIIGAGALVRERAVIEPGSLVAGVPAKLLRELTEDAYETNLKWSAKYVKLARLHRRKYGMESVM